MPGRDGVKGDVGRTGMCISTPEWEQWKLALNQWIAAWDDFTNNGGLTPCQDYRDAVDEVDSFLDGMIDWYNDLLSQNLAMYESTFNTLDADIDASYRRCKQAQDDQKDAILRQFQDIQDQIDFIWENPNPANARP